MGYTIKDSKIGITYFNYETNRGEVTCQVVIQERYLTCKLSSQDDLDSDEAYDYELVYSVKDERDQEMEKEDFQKLLGVDMDRFAVECLQWFGFYRSKFIINKSIEHKAIMKYLYNEKGMHFLNNPGLNLNSTVEEVKKKLSQEHMFDLVKKLVTDGMEEGEDA